VSCVRPARGRAPQVYPRLFNWRELERGSHFAALEVSELFTEELGPLLPLVGPPAPNRLT
jgi:hypothetical protein